MPITLMYSSLLALIFAVLSLRVIKGRGSNKVSLGDGGIEAMTRLVRAHANFAEYVPFCLILIALLEMQQAPTALLHGLGAGLVAGRLLHGYALAFSKHFPIGRAGGTLLTLLVLLTAAIAGLYYSL